VAEITLERLKKIPLTKELTEEEVNSLLPRVVEENRSKGERLFREGQPAENLYFVESGKVSEVGGPRRRPVPRYAGPGDYLGRYALVTGQPYRVTAKVDQDAKLLVIPLRDLQPILFLHPEWRSWFFHIDIAARLRALPLFRSLDDWDLYILADKVDVEDLPARTTVFRAEDPADYFYIVDRGRVAQYNDKVEYRAAGNFFGLPSLKAHQRQGTTVITQTESQLYRIPGEALRELVAIRTGAMLRDLQPVNVARRLRGVPLLRELKDPQRQLLAGYVKLVYQPPGVIVAQQGEPATSLMILDDGEAIVRRQVGQDRPRPVRYFKADRGETEKEDEDSTPTSVYFGDHALLAPELRGATVEVTEPSTWIILEREDFQQFLKDTGLTAHDLGETRQPPAPTSKARPPKGDLPQLPYLVHRHWIVPVTRILPIVFFMVLIAVLLLAGMSSNLSGVMWNVVRFGGILILLLLAFWVIYRYVDWRNDTYEVTDEAVIHREKKLFFSQERYEIPLRQIQNVNILISPLGQTLLYGDIDIDTAAARGRIIFTKIPRPAFVQRLIQDASAEARSGRRVQYRESIRQKLEDQFNPERLKPVVPGSVLIQAETQKPRPSRFDRFRTLRGFLPRFEIREADRVTWRKHWFNLIVRTWLPLLVFLFASYLMLSYSLAFVSEVFGFARPIYLPPVSWLGFQTWLFLLLLLGWVLALLWLIYQYAEWRNDIYILTDDEVIDVQRELAIYPLFFLYTESRRTASLANVQFVDFRIPNPVAVILNYGHVIIQTAGAEGTLDFLALYNPSRVHGEIIRRLAEYQEKQREREFEERWEDMAEWFEAYDNMRDHT